MIAPGWTVARRSSAPAARTCSHAACSASVFDRDGIEQLMELVVGERFPRLAHLWLDAGYNGKGKGREIGSRRRSA